MLKYILVFVSTWTFVIGLYSYRHSSQISLRRLYDLQNEQFTVARDYLNLETERIQYLERKWIPIFEWYVNNTIDKDYITINNSVWCLKLMQWIFDYSKLFTSMMNDEQSLIAFEKFNEAKAISEFDLQSVGKSLRRIQRVYSIPASNMANGRYKDRIIGDQMNTCECYIMAKYCFENKDLYSALDWAIQTHNKWLDDRPKCVDTEKLHFYIKSISVSLGFNFETLPKFNELHQSDNSEKFTDYFSLMANETFVQDIETLSDIFYTYDDYWEFDKRSKTFQKLCRTGKSIRPLTNNSKCRYQTKNSPYRILIPFKEEVISINPDIKLYHDLLYDDEIITVTKMAENNLTDALFYLSGKSSLADERRSGQLKWFSDDSNHELFGKLNERLECLTGYSTATAEGYQTVNYGAGGHFSLHIDAFTDMTDVPDDGYTVFPNLNYVAHCKKGTALVWTNLHLNNGSVHSGTFHGGCPVIKGNKWIMTKGLYESGQPITYNWEANKKITIV